MFKKYSIIFTLLSMPFLAHAISTAELDRIVTAQGQLLTEYQQQITDLEQEVDVLRGQLQETTYKLDQTIERQKSILQQLARDSSSSVPAVESADKASEASTTKGLINWKPIGNEKNDYNYIVSVILTGKEPKNAIVAMQQFIKTYPKSTYQASANYWLGQLNYGMAQKSDASYYFAYVIKNYPQSAKASESMYKIGMILLEQGEKAKAKMIFQQVIAQYPKDTAIVNQAKQQLINLS